MTNTEKLKSYFGGEFLKEWSPREDFYRFYDGENSYCQVTVKEKGSTRTGWYKLVNMTEERFEEFFDQITYKTNSVLVKSKF